MYVLLSRKWQLGHLVFYLGTYYSLRWLSPSFACIIERGHDFQHLLPLLWQESGQTCYLQWNILCIVTLTVSLLLALLALTGMRLNFVNTSFVTSKWVRWLTLPSTSVPDCSQASRPRWWCGRGGPLRDNNRTQEQRCFLPVFLPLDAFEKAEELSHISYLIYGRELWSYSGQSVR